jgi:hypothetical protein
MKKGVWTISIILLLGMSSSYYLGCNKTNSPFGVYAPHGLDVPSFTPTPAIGAINCYVFDGSPKMGVTVNLVDPIGNTLFTKTTDQYGNAPFSPYPLVVGTYSANVPKQGRYGYSSSPIIIASTSQGAVSIQFLAASQALSITGGIPISFGTGTGAFPVTLTYFQPGTLDVPVSVSNSSLPSAWTSAPISFVMSMAVSTRAVTINKISCFVLNQPVTWSGVDFLNIPFINTSTIFYRNFPVNVTLTASVSSVSGCTTGKITSFNAIYTISSSNDCNYSWAINGSIGSSLYGGTLNTYISNGQSVSESFATTSAAGGCFGCCVPASTPPNSVTISSPMGTAIGSGLNGVIINTSF